IWRWCGRATAGWPSRARSGQIDSNDETRTLAEHHAAAAAKDRGTPMAGSVNKVILIGNLGRDPEIRTLNSGDRVANLRVATSETWRDRASGERKERTEWHRVVIFNDNLVKVAEQYLRKGSKIYLEGAIQTRKWQDQSGQEKYSTEIVLQKYRG